jgi:serpin B
VNVLFSLLAICLMLPVAAWAAQTPDLAEDRATAVDGNNAFAVDLYGQLRNRSGNLFFSPESISTALAMTYAGARGETAAEMAKTLHFTLPPERLNPAMGALLADLNAAHEGYELHLANALWAEQDFTILDAFLGVMSADYGASFRKLDFKDSPDAAREVINKWVEEKTQDKIKDLLQPGILNGKTKLVLTNAIYFKGNWRAQFDKSATSDEDFHLSAEQTVKAPMMHREGGFSYFDGGAFQALELPYKTGDLSMIVLLPRDIGGLSALEQSLTPSSLKQWLGELHPAPKVILSLPRFKMTQQFGLGGTLAAMGMPQAFDARADFTGMTERRELFISAVIHKAFIDVNEEGTEAAAATAVVTMRPQMAMRPQPPIVFRADHPFLFLIRDNGSGSILFMGRVNDPEK